jgi:hypothetical protein
VKEDLGNVCAVATRLYKAHGVRIDLGLFPLRLVGGQLLDS